MAPFRVLILEDDAILALDLETIVCCWTDAEVTACRSIAQARKAMTDGFDLALLDIDVVDGKSYEFAESLRSSKLPFAFVSGAMQDDCPETLRDAAFIPKPYTQRAIESVVASAAGARRHP
ncbi:response regulator [Methylopila sp. 73B]|uniref:response regulator n=1 Tax=Methylopila sp. 73B TaxID=1120792 RepID=UPI00035D7268|nr:response regulator [Methylopila sp. 73B]